MPADASSTFLTTTGLAQVEVSRAGFTTATLPLAVTTSTVGSRVVLLSAGQTVQLVAMRGYSTAFWPSSGNVARPRGTDGLLYPAQSS